MTMHPSLVSSTYQRGDRWFSVWSVLLDRSGKLDQGNRPVFPDLA
jgi:hypothetical protein